MGIEKAVLLNLTTGENIPVMFNPEEYTVDSANSFAELAIPGLRVPPVQFGRGIGRTLKMDLFFDTTDFETDVRDPADRVNNLLEKDPSTKGPPVLLFLWGGVQFKCVLERVSQRFTRFLSNGMPVRVTLSATFKEYQEVEVTIQRGLFVGPPMIRTVAATVVTAVAAKVLGDPSRWREIAEENKIDNPRKILAGAVLRLPGP